MAELRPAGRRFDTAAAIKLPNQENVAAMERCAAPARGRRGHRGVRHTDRRRRRPGPSALERRGENLL